MILMETKKCLSRLLLNLGNCERSAEITREILAQNKDLDPFQAFKYLDIDGKSNIDSTNIVDFLLKNGIYCTPTEAQFIILFTDENSDGLLSYSEFLTLVLPESNYSLRRLARERAGTGAKGVTLPFNVEYTLVKLLEKELNVVRSTQIILEELKLKQEYDPLNLFHCLKKYEFITFESLRTFFDQLNESYCDEDLKAIIKRLDFNADGRVDFEEFHCFLTFPQCAKCSCYHHHSCCKRPSIDTSININQLQSSKQSQLSNRLKSHNFLLTPSEMKISPYLSLRVSPERHYSPKRHSPIREHHIRESNQFYKGNSFLRTSSPPRPRQRGTNAQNNCVFSSTEVNSLGEHSLIDHSFCQFIGHPGFYCQSSYDNGVNLFLSYFKDMSSIELQIERSKIDLALSSDFNVEDAFSLFEVEMRGYISKADLHYGLSLLDINASDLDLKLLMKRVDIKRSGFISYADFFDMLAPFEKDYRLMVEKRFPSPSCHIHCNKSNVFLIGTKIYLQSLLRLIISSERQLDNIKLGLSEVREQLKLIFEEISRSNSAFTQIDLSFFLKRKGVASTDQKTSLAFIRLDKKRKEQVDYWELLEELS